MKNNYELDLCINLLVYAGLSSKHTEDMTVREVLEAAALFFGERMVEKAITSMGNSQETLDDIRYEQPDFSHIRAMVDQMEIMEPDIQRIGHLVSNNPEIFGDKPAGELALKIAAEFLEAVCRGDK